MEQDVRRFLARCEASGLAPGTVRNYRMALTKFASSVDKESAAVDAADVEDFLDIECAGLAHGSKQATRSALSSFFGYLQRRGKVSGNPVDGVKLAAKPRRRPTYYTTAEAARLLAAGDRPRDKLLIRIGLTHGQRIGAIVRLRWADVDFERATVTYGAWKTTRSLRLPLDVETARMLRAWYALRPSDEWVFPGRSGKALGYNAALRVVQRQCRLAGLPYRGSHELRRTCITTLLQAGEPLHLVSKEIAGHATVATTVQCYAGSDDADVAAAIRRLPY